MTHKENYGYVGYTHALGIDAPVGMIRNREVVVLHQDWRGKYAWSTDEDGNGTACAAGGACGARYPWPGAAPFSYGLNPDFGRTHIWYGSLAKDQYDQSGLQYRRNRYYDPMLGQFTQDDPIGVAGGLNTYGYAAGDPVNFSDPFGLSPIELDGLEVTVRPNDCHVDMNTCWGRARPMAWQQAAGGGSGGMAGGGGGFVLGPDPDFLTCAVDAALRNYGVTVDAIDESGTLNLTQFALRTVATASYAAPGGAPGAFGLVDGMLRNPVGRTPTYVATGARAGALISGKAALVGVGKRTIVAATFSNLGFKAGIMIGSLSVGAFTCL